VPNCTGRTLSFPATFVPSTGDSTEVEQKLPACDRDELHPDGVAGITEPVLWTSIVARWLCANDVLKGKAMKSRASFPVAVLVVLGLVSTWQLCGGSAVAQDAAIASKAVMVAHTLVDGDAEYIGSNACKKCHIKQYKSWADGKHANAMDALKPGNASDVKQKFGLDPAKDYTTDETCLECHTVGFGKPGGYAVPTAGDKKAEKHAKYTASVGCEMCHGAGGAFEAQHEEIMKSKREYTTDEMYAAGMNKIDETTCKRCHNEKSPTIDASTYKFDYEQRLKDGVHEHFELKQRKE